jgi:hypothetical protein
MAAGNVQWVTSQKGNPPLVLDDYLFTCNGKGKFPTVRYWSCASGCPVNVKTDGNQVINVTGVHDHVNDTSLVQHITLKVRMQQYCAAC